MLDFAKWVLCICWDDPIIFLCIQFLNYSKWFLNVKPILHTWDKHHLVVSYFMLYILLGLFHYFFRNFKSLVMIVYLLVMCQSGFHIKVCWLHKMRWEFSFLVFEQYDKCDILSSMNEKTQQWSHVGLEFSLK